MRKNVLGKTQATAQVLFVLVRVWAKTKAKWSSPEVSPGFPKKSLLSYFILHPYINDRCYTCILLLQQMQTGYTWTKSFALRFNARHDRKMRGETGFARLTWIMPFFTPKIENNWKYLGNSGDLEIVYTANENNWPKCLYILKLQGRDILKITRSSSFYCLKKT